MIVVLCVVIGCICLSVIIGAFVFYKMYFKEEKEKELNEEEEAIEKNDLNDLNTCKNVFFFFFFEGNFIKNLFDIFCRW